MSQAALSGVGGTAPPATGAGLFPLTATAVGSA
jgi:hypothetical protein